MDCRRNAGAFLPNCPGEVSVLDTSAERGRSSPSPRGSATLIKQPLLNGPPKLATPVRGCSACGAASWERSRPDRGSLRLPFGGRPPHARTQVARASGWTVGHASVTPGQVAVDGVVLECPGRKIRGGRNSRFKSEWRNFSSRVLNRVGNAGFLSG